VARPLKGWILYDGGWGFCFRWVHFWEKVVARRGFDLKDLQSAEEEGILQVSLSNLLDDIRVLKVDGGLECGADAYLFVAKADCDPVRPSWVQLGFVVWVSLVQPETLSRFAALPVAREEVDGSAGKTLVWRLLRAGSVMAHPVQAEGSETCDCPYCGKQIGAHVERCPFCREAVATSRRVVRPFAAKGRAMIRRGMLYVLLAGVVPSR